MHLIGFIVRIYHDARFSEIMFVVFIRQLGPACFMISLGLPHGTHVFRILHPACFGHSVAWIEMP